MSLGINTITVQRQIVLTSSKFIVSSYVCGAIVFTLIDGHCDGGGVYRLFSSSETRRMIGRSIKGSVA